MISNVETQLAALIDSEGDELLAQWRQQVRQLPSARHLDTPTLNDHIPELLAELSAALQAKSEQTIAQALREGSPPAHGLQRVQDGFDIEEVVAEYNILRDCIHDLADRHQLSLQGKPFHILNRVLDKAIGLAVQTYATRRALEVRLRREEYLAFVAHDLRTPLNAISLAARVLELTAPQHSGTDASRMLNALRRNVQHLERLVGKIMEENSSLESESGAPLQRRAFDLWPFIESIIHDLHPVAGAAGTRLTNLVPDDLVVYGDGGLLRRVFQNLIANAIKYSPGGEVVIEAHGVGEDGAVACKVSDNGAGISTQHLAKVFDKGETDPQIAGGTGLGLSIVKSFTEAHGGTVSVESKEGIGTTFRLSLPGKSGDIVVAAPT